MNVNKIAEAVNTLSDVASASRNLDESNRLRAVAQGATDELEPIVNGKYTPHFNGLDPATQEALAILAGDAADIGKVAAKIIQHGLDSTFDGFRGQTNRDELTRQIAWLEVTVAMLVKLGVLEKSRLDREAVNKIEFYRDPANRKILHHLKRL